jgi:ABC-type Zn uptake system ZnuABC Zn-binding protein ZnuA
VGNLIEEIRSTGAPAIFLETGSNPGLAQQVARETGVEVVTDLYTHSLGEGAPTYLDMMRRNVDIVVEALR